MQFGLFTYNYSENIGDEVQSLAAARYLPRVDRLIERDRLQWYADGPATFVIFNGWFTRVRCWPPPSAIKPLLVSFYAHRPDDLIKGDYREYFNAHGPVGCRSTATAQQFEKAGINAYFSGCLTLTLKRPNVEKSDAIYSLEPEQDLYEGLVPESIRRRAVSLSNEFPGPDAAIVPKSAWPLSFLCMRVINKADPGRRIFRKSRERFEAFRHRIKTDMAENTLKKLAAARLVITSRLHCAMPCLAMGTPVVLLRKGVETDPRFAGLWQFARSSSCLSTRVPINWEDPEPNAPDYLTVADPLRQKCENAVARAATGVAEVAIL